MKASAFGRSGLNVSEIGLGLAALGRPGYINMGHAEDLGGTYSVEVMEQRTHHMLSLARQLGINYFDAAQSYGMAELFLGNWLAQHPEEKVVVGSKWGYYYTADWSVEAENHEIKDHSIARLEQQWPESKQRLAPGLKLYQIHSATFESGVLGNGAVLEKLEQIRSEGYLIGLSLSGVQQGEVLDKAMTIRIGGEPLFGAVQATYNCLEQSAGEALSRAHDAGLGVIIKEGLANGRLTSRNAGAPYLTAIEALADRHGVGVDAISMAYILSRPFVGTVLSGAATPTHLESNVRAAEVSLSVNDLRHLDSLKMNPKDYWGTRSDMAWN